MSDQILSRTAHAKINLALHITGQQKNGYHLLDSVVCFSTLGDRLEIRLAENPAQPVSLEITGPFADDLGATSENLVTKAAHALAQHLSNEDVQCPAVNITLEKNLPIASGIGGGSADAAAVLVLLEKMWAKAGNADLKKIAIGLGADVAMCLNPQPKRVQGTGQHLSPFSLSAALPLVLVNPGQTLSTPDVFRALKTKSSPSIGSDKIPNLPTISAAVDFISPLRNDLHQPAVSLVPHIVNVLTAIKNQPGCHLARMSGSGATCFGIFETSALAKDAAKRIAKDNPGWWAKATISIPHKES